MLHHACAPTHPEPMSQGTLQISDPIFFISRIPVLNFAGTTRNRLHHACVPTLNQRSKDAPQNLRPQDFHLTHPSFELCRSSSPYYTTHVCQPWTNVPKVHHKTSDPKIFISHIPVLNFAGTALHVTPRIWANPSWTNVPRHTTNFRSDFCSSHTSLFWTLPEQPGTDYTTHVCQPWTNVPKIHHKTSDSPKIFISRIPVLNFAGTARHVTPRMWANPSCTNVPRYTTND